jgi:surfeit locus 1 family protein
MRILALVIGVVAATVFARLGVWQLDRLGERRAWNREVAARLEAPPLTLRSGLVSAPVGSLVYRRVKAAGVFAFADQRAEPNRSLRGLPGAYVVTPLRFADGTGVLVQRGFAAAPDGMTIDPARLVEPESTVVEGVLLSATGRLAVHPESVSAGYPLLPLVIRRTTRVSGMPEGLAVAGLPPLDAGPHLSYAVQWFAFALIALIGGVLLSRRTVRPGGRAPPSD